MLSWFGDRPSKRTKLASGYQQPWGTIVLEPQPGQVAPNHFHACSREIKRASFVLSLALLLTSEAEVGSSPDQGGHAQEGKHCCRDRVHHSHWYLVGQFVACKHGGYVRDEHAQGRADHHH